MEMVGQKMRAAPKKRLVLSNRKRRLLGPARKNRSMRPARERAPRRCAKSSDLGGFVAGDFHADADFDNHRGRPGHVHLLLKKYAISGDASPCFSLVRPGRFELAREVARSLPPRNSAFYDRPTSNLPEAIAIRRESKSRPCHRRPCRPRIVAVCARAVSPRHGSRRRGFSQRRERSRNYARRNRHRSGRALAARRE